MTTLRPVKFKAVLFYLLSFRGSLANDRKNALILSVRVNREIRCKCNIRVDVTAGHLWFFTINFSWIFSVLKKEQIKQVSLLCKKWGQHRDGCISWKIVPQVSAVGFMRIISFPSLFKSGFSRKESFSEKSSEDNAGGVTPGLLSTVRFLASLTWFRSSIKQAKHVHNYRTISYYIDLHCSISG